MNRLRTITERDRLAPLVEQITQGEDMNLIPALALQALDIAQAGRAALLDALAQQEQADAQLAEAIRKLLHEQP